MATRQQFRSRVRTVGSGFTTFQWRGHNIAWLEEVRDTGQAPGGTGAGTGGGGPGWEAITPLARKHPTEIVTSRYLMAGTLTVTIRELWDEPVWQQLQGLARADNIIEVFEALGDIRQEITCQMIIKPPGPNRNWRGKVYHNCEVVTIDDSETVAIATLSIPRNLTIAYTHTTKASFQG